MGLRFRKSISILPGVKLNLGTKGASVSVGKRGMHYTMHTSGRKTVSVGLPGTGLSYVKTLDSGKKSSKKSTKPLTGYRDGKSNAALQQTAAQELAAAQQEAVQQDQNSWKTRIKNVVIAGVGAAGSAFVGSVGSRMGEAAAQAVFK